MPGKEEAFKNYWNSEKTAMNNFKWISWSSILCTKIRVMWLHLYRLLGDKSVLIHFFCYLWDKGLWLTLFFHPHKSASIYPLSGSRKRIISHFSWVSVDLEKKHVSCISHGNKQLLDLHYIKLLGTQCPMMKMFP